MLVADGKKLSVVVGRVKVKTLTSELDFADVEKNCERVSKKVNKIFY